MTPDNNKFNKDIGSELLGWLLSMRITLQDIINSKRTLQKSCCLHCVYPEVVNIGELQKQNVQPLEVRG